MEEFPYSSLKHCGKDVRIHPTVVIRNPELVSIGDHVAIDAYTCITTALEIGDYVHIAQLCTIIGGAKARCSLASFVALAAGCRLICGSDDFLGSGLTNPTVPEKYRAPAIYGDISLEKHVILGTNCIVHPGMTVGEGTAVASASVIRKSLAPWIIAAGNPATRIGPRPRTKILALERQLREEQE